MGRMIFSQLRKPQLGLKNISKNDKAPVILTLKLMDYGHSIIIWLQGEK